MYTEDNQDCTKWCVLTSSYRTDAMHGHSALKMSQSVWGRQRQTNINKNAENLKYTPFDFKVMMLGQLNQYIQGDVQN
jgi:hypothetical protein